MKKYFILISLLIILCLHSQGQVKIGISALPGLSVNRISLDSDTLSLNNDGVGFKIALGIQFDFEMRKNYYFNTGLFWVPKRVGLKMENKEYEQKRVYKLQYIQIPFNFKLMTDEVSIDKWLFFQFGLAFEMKVDGSNHHLEEFYLEKFNFLDIVLDFGSGLEIKLGQNTICFMGITYYRGLLNTIKPMPFLKGDIKAKNDYWALNLGLKF